MKEKLCASCGGQMDRHSKVCRGCYLKAVELDPEEWRIRRCEETRRWRAANPERAKQIARKSRRKWAAANPEKEKEVQRFNRERLRKQILSLIGDAKCKHCGFSDWRALHLDHINGGGNKDLVRGLPRTAGAGIWKIRKWIQENIAEAKAKYQVLCANCNWIKRHENAECRKGSCLTPTATSSSSAKFSLSTIR